MFPAVPNSIRSEPAQKPGQGQAGRTAGHERAGFRSGNAARTASAVADRDRCSLQCRTRSDLSPLKSPVKARPGVRRDTSVQVSAAETPPAPPPLSLIEIDVPFSAELDLAPLLTALQKPPDSDGGWYGLRERFAHLGLAQGFDELL